MALERPGIAGDCVIRLATLGCASDQACDREFCLARGFGHSISTDGIGGCTHNFCETDDVNEVGCLRVLPLSSERQTCLAPGDGEPMHAWVDAPSTEQSVLYWLDAAFNFVYVVELLVKFVALSVRGYFSERWNCLDFLIVLSSCIGMLFSESDVKVFKYFRLLRILRPIRLIAKAKTMRMMMESMILSAVAIVNVELLLIFFIMIFSIIGNNLFAGLFYDCSREEGAGIEWETECIGTFIQTTVDCDQDRHNQTCVEGISIGERKWENYPQNFDNILSSFMTFFQLATLQGWTDVARLTIDATEVGHVPVVHNKPYMIVFTLSYVLFCSYFFMNIFVGVIYANFQELKNVYTGKREMDFYQLRWLDVLEMVDRSTPTPNLLPPPVSRTSWRAKAFRIVSNSRFEKFIGCAILVNTLLLAFEYYTMPAAFADFMAVCNVVFTVIFVVEAALKVYALGGSQYWLHGWNRFDLAIATVAVVELLLQIVEVSAGTEFVKVFRLGRVVARMLKIARVGRAVRIAESIHGVKVLFATVSKSIPVREHLP